MTESFATVTVTLVGVPRIVSYVASAAVVVVVVGLVVGVGETNKFSYDEDTMGNKLC